MKLKNKLKLITLLAIMSCLFAGCGSIEFDIADTIQPPVNKNLAIEGTWEIDRYISLKKDAKTVNEENDIYQKKYIGKPAIFDNEIGAVGSDVCITPKYRIIKTSADTFIQNKYRIDESSLGLGEEDINVVTVTTDNRLFYEILVTDNKTAYVYLNNGFLVMSKQSGEVDAELKEHSFNNVGMSINNGEYKEDPLLRSGVLIGIRSADNSYHTLWVYSKNREIQAIKERNQLLVPRAKGFFEVGVESSSEKKNVNIYSIPFIDSVLQENTEVQAKTDLLSTAAGTRILFVGNDYIGTESNQKFKVLPIDNLGRGYGVQFSEVLDQKSDNVYQESRDSFISTLKGAKAQNVIKQSDEQNFSLMRRNGHWIFRSRAYFKEPVDNVKYQDFDLKLMVPSKLIQYDEMDIPWNEIKSRIPWTTDAYMSPNKDIAILVSADGLSLYPIKNKSIINSKQLVKIPLSKGDTIIMTEWAIGRYADIWAKFADQIFTDVQSDDMNY